MGFSWFLKVTAPIVFFVFLVCLLSHASNGLPEEDFFTAPSKRSTWKNNQTDSAFWKDYFMPETGVDETLVMTMLGASTYRTVMRLRREQNATKSDNVIVIFSIRTPCEHQGPRCTDTNFTIMIENETNFTVKATLVSNSDLNAKCQQRGNQLRAWYTKYHGHPHGQHPTEVFRNYFIVYKCGELEIDDLLVNHSNSKDAKANLGTIGVFLHFLCCLLYLCLHFKPPTSAAAPAGQVSRIIEDDENSVSSSSEEGPSAPGTRRNDSGDVACDNAGFEAEDEPTTSDVAPLLPIQ